jgi:dienelactone hydrolase
MTKAFISRNGHRYDGSPFRDRVGGKARDVYRRGTGPAVILIHEAGGLNHTTFDIADRLVAEGFKVLLPVIVGQPREDDGTKTSAGINLARLCISWQVHVFLTGRTSPVVRWLRALAAKERGDHPGVGIIGMCFSGGFALAAAVDDTVVAAIASQPALPWPLLP